MSGKYYQITSGKRILTIGETISDCIEALAFIRTPVIVRIHDISHPDSLETQKITINHSQYHKTFPPQTSRVEILDYVAEDLLRKFRYELNQVEKIL